MSYILHITATAEKDLNHAADYIEFTLKNPQAADHLLNEVTKQINALLTFPKKHPLAADKLLASWGIRFIKIGNYLAFYIVSEETEQIIVVRFLYEKSNWTSILKHGFPLA